MNKEFLIKNKIINNNNISKEKKKENKSIDLVGKKMNDIGIEKNNNAKKELIMKINTNKKINNCEIKEKNKSSSNLEFFDIKKNKKIKDKDKSEKYKNSNIKQEGNDENKYDIIFLEKYHPSNIKLEIINQEIIEDGKIITEYSNHKKEIIFNNKDESVCLKKEIFDDGYQIIYFKNKDIKQIYPDGKTVYFFSENNTVATTFSNGKKVYKFANGQIEKFFVNGEKKILYPDGTIKNIYSNGEEEIIYNDGSKQRKKKDGSIFVKYKNGIEDIIINGNKNKKICNGRKTKMKKDRLFSKNNY